jgi:hypothetical protein
MSQTGQSASALRQIACRSESEVLSADGAPTNNL